MVNFIRTKPWAIYPKPGVLLFVNSKLFTHPLEQCIMMFKVMTTYLLNMNIFPTS